MLRYLATRQVPGINRADLVLESALMGLGHISTWVDLDSESLGSNQVPRTTVVEFLSGSVGLSLLLGCNESLV